MDKLGLPDRFWRKVLIGKPNECWIWIGSVNPEGYGRLYVKKRKTMAAHRAVLIAKTGGDSNGMHACHKCDFPACVNPNHLFWGTRTDNLMDSIRKGRRPVINGERNHNRKLCDRIVLDMRREYSDSPKRKDGSLINGLGVKIARKYKTCYRNFLAIVRRRTWSHI